MGGAHVEVGPFEPPYALGGAMVVIVGTWAAPPALPVPERLAGYRPVRVFGALLGIIVGSDFQQPPEALPIRYHEVIASVLVRRGLRFASLPFDMRLDAPVPVELGHRHYSMPKQLDPDLEVHVTPDAVRIRGSVDVDARVHATLLRLLLLPLSLCVTLGVWAVTHLTDVIGAADQPTRAARVALTPAGLGRSYALRLSTFAGLPLRPLWCQGYAHCTTVLGRPRPLHTENAL